jgi:hypothetical protein
MSKESRPAMSYLNLFSLHNLAMLSDWLEESGELFVHVYFPRRGGMNSGYLIQSLEDLKQVVLTQDWWYQIEFTVYRGKRNSLDGIASEALLEQAFQQFREDENFDIFYLPDDVRQAHCAGCGKGHIELRRDLTYDYGEPVVIVGECKQPGIKAALVVEATTHNQLQVKRSQDFYEPFSRHPERYEWIAELWQE